MLHGDKNNRRKYALLFIAPLLVLAAPTGPLHAQETGSSVRNFEERFFFGKDALYPRMKRRDLGPLLSPLPLSLPPAFLAPPDAAPQPETTAAGDASASSRPPTADEIIEFASFQQILTIAAVDPVWPSLPASDESASSAADGPLPITEVASADQPTPSVSLPPIAPLSNAAPQIDENRAGTSHQTSEPPRLRESPQSGRRRVVRASKSNVVRSGHRVARQSQGGVSAARRNAAPQNAAREGLAASGSYEFFVAGAHARFEQSVFRSRSN